MQHLHIGQYVDAVLEHVCVRYDHVTGENGRGGKRDRAMVGLEKKVVLEMFYKF